MSSNSLPPLYGSYVYRRIEMVSRDDGLPIDANTNSRSNWQQRYLVWDPNTDLFTLYLSRSTQDTPVWNIHASQVVSVRRTRETIISDLQYKLGQDYGDPDDVSVVDNIQKKMKGIVNHIKFWGVESNIAAIRYLSKKGHATDEFCLATKSEEELENWIGIFNKVINARWFKKMSLPSTATKTEISGSDASERGLAEQYGDSVPGREQPLPKKSEQANTKASPPVRKWQEESATSSPRKWNEDGVNVSPPSGSSGHTVRSSDSRTSSTSPTKRRHSDEYGIPPEQASISSSIFSAPRKEKPEEQLKPIPPNAQGPPSAQPRRNPPTRPPPEVPARTSPPAKHAAEITMDKASTTKSKRMAISFAPNTVVLSDNFPAQSDSRPMIAEAIPAGLLETDEYGNVSAESLDMIAEYTSSPNPMRKLTLSMDPRRLSSSKTSPTKASPIDRLDDKMRTFIASEFAVKDLEDLQDHAALFVAITALENDMLDAKQHWYHILHDGRQTMVDKKLAFEMNRDVLDQANEIRLFFKRYYDETLINNQEVLNDERVQSIGTEKNLRKFGKRVRDDLKSNVLALRQHILFAEKQGEDDVIPDYTVVEFLETLSDLKQSLEQVRSLCRWIYTVSSK